MHILITPDFTYRVPVPAACRSQVDGAWFDSERAINDRGFVFNFAWLFTEIS